MDSRTRTEMDSKKSKVVESNKRQDVRESCDHPYPRGKRHIKGHSAPPYAATLPGVGNISVVPDSEK